MVEATAVLFQKKTTKHRWFEGYSLLGIFVTCEIKKDDFDKLYRHVIFIFFFSAF